MGYLNNIAKVAVLGASFSANAAGAQEAYSDIEPYENSTVSASVDCIEGALRKTFGAENEIYTDEVQGMISTNEWVGDALIGTDVYLGLNEAVVASINMTITDGPNSLSADDNGTYVLRAAPIGTANIIYRGEEGIQDYSSQGYDGAKLKDYINKMDTAIRSCSSNMALAMS